MRKKFLSVAVLSGVLAAGLGVVLFVPVKLHADYIGESCYEGMSMSIHDFVVYGESMVGFRTNVKNASVTLVGNDTVVVSGPAFSEQLAINRIPITDIQIEYNQDIYQYDKLNMKNFTVKGIYADGTERDINDFFVNVSGRVEGPEKLDFLIYEKEYPYELDPIMVSDIQATYSGDAIPGTEFDPDLVNVTVVFEDGETVRLDTATVNYSGKLKTGDKITVNCGMYGEVDLDLTVKEPYDVITSCVYDKYQEGVLLTKDSFDFALRYEGVAKPVVVSDFKVEPSVMHTSGNVMLISDIYGSYECYVDVLPIKEFRGIVEQDKYNDWEIDSLYRVYTDDEGKEVKVSIEPEDVEVVSDFKGFKDGDEVRFKWNGEEYSFEGLLKESYDEKYAAVPEPESEPIPVPEEPEESTEAEGSEETTETVADEPVDWAEGTGDIDIY